MDVLLVVICSTRPGRKGPAVASWFLDQAKSSQTFDVKHADLSSINLPMFDEPEHPSQQKYTHEHTKKWSAIVSSADAFVFVTPEYNYSPPPPLLNALDYLYKEWNYKPAAFVSYGGISGGMRSVEVTKHVLTTLKMVPIVEAVAIPSFMKQIDDGGKFVPNEGNEKAAKSMLNELAKWSGALKKMRQ